MLLCTLTHTHIYKPHHQESKVHRPLAEAEAEEEDPSRKAHIKQEAADEVEDEAGAEAGATRMT